MTHRAVRWTLAVAALAAPAFAGNLQFYPARLHLGDTKRVAGITFRYKGDKPEKYRVSATFWRMTPEGVLQRVEKLEQVKPEERPLNKFIRFSPREFELKPDAEQTVQVMYSGPGGLPEGEYRAQLLVEPDYEISGKPPVKEKSAAAQQQLRFEVETKIAYAIPVIFRRGKPTFEVALEKPAVQKAADGKATGTVELVAKGNAFAYGDVEVLKKGEGSERQSVGVVRGIAAYVDRRRVDVPLTIPVDAAKNLVFVFRSAPESASNVSAEVELGANP